MRISLLAIFISINAFAQMRLTPTDPDINLEKIPREVKIDREVSRGAHISPQERDVILNRLFPNELKHFDDVDRDILYKSILNYPEEKLLKKYPFIKKDSYQQVKDAFK